MLGRDGERVQDETGRGWVSTEQDRKYHGVDVVGGGDGRWVRDVEEGRGRESEKSVESRSVEKMSVRRRGRVVKWKGHDDVGWMSLIFVDW